MIANGKETLIKRHAWLATTEQPDLPVAPCLVFVLSTITMRYSHRYLRYLGVLINVLSGCETINIHITMFSGFQARVFFYNMVIMCFGKHGCNEWSYILGSADFVSLT